MLKIEILRQMTMFLYIFANCKKILLLIAWREFIGKQNSLEDYWHMHIMCELK